MNYLIVNIESVFNLGRYINQEFFFAKFLLAYVALAAWFGLVVSSPPGIIWAVRSNPARVQGGSF
jgi:hypothetical protein